jgi:BASS family bile acid:Na+ symporter
MASEANQLLGPFMLFSLMFVVGLELTPADFRRVASAPRAVVVGTLAQLLLLPLMTWVVVTSLGVSPVFGAGAVLVAVSPGAGLSNVLVALCGANIALSVTLTAVSSVLAVVTLPVVTSIAMRVFLDEETNIEVQVAPLMQQLTFALLLPIGLGMTVRTKFPQFVHRHKRALQRIAGAIIAVLITAVVVLSVMEDEQPDLAGIERVLVAAVVWTAAAMVLGWGIASLLRLPRADRATFLIEFSARNIAVATIVALSSLGRLDLTLFSGAYGAVGFPMVVVAAIIMRRRFRRADGEIVPG